MIFQHFESLFGSDYSSLLNYISPHAFNSIRWKEALPSLQTMAKNYLSSQNALAFEPPPGIRLVEQLHGAELSTRWTTASRREFGEKILLLYFTQLHQKGPICLDLRHTHFRVNDGLCWKPASLVHTFDQEFCRKILGLYGAFHDNNRERAEHFARTLGLVPKSESAEAIVSLLQEHFAYGHDRAVTFRLTHFSQVFHRLFEYLMKHRVQIPGDFLFFGIYLVTLYASLEALAGRYNVGGAWIKAVMAPHKSS